MISGYDYDSDYIYVYIYIYIMVLQRLQLSAMIVPLPGFLLFSKN